ncbi:hypothetical protein Scep_030326 [Stephania cephalantha]|uniref:Uncharacterized protein n=1 Tax=Stephania cephalantha TaxID=152367 RepID=A0AAP0E289_9MAGN
MNYLNLALQIDVKRSMEKGESRFNQLSIEEHGKFDEETLVNVDGIKRRESRSRKDNGFSNDYIVVCVTAARPTRGLLRTAGRLNTSLHLLARNRVHSPSHNSGPSPRGHRVLALIELCTTELVRLSGTQLDEREYCVPVGLLGAHGLVERAVTKMLWLNGTRLDETTPFSLEGAVSSRGGGGNARIGPLGGSSILGVRQALRQVVCPNISADLKEALQKLASIPTSRTLAVEVLWTPQKENDALSEQQLLEDYPLLKPL